MPRIRERFDVPADFGPAFADPRPATAPPPLAEPPLGVLEAARRRPLVVAAALVVALVLALAAGLTRAPVHTATAQLRVGAFDVNVPGALTGYAATSAALAATYSRSVDEPSVLAAVARELGVRRERVLDVVSASPLPESAIFRVRAQAPAAGRAVAFANATALALARLQLGVTPPAQRARRLGAYQRAAERLAGARAAQRARQADYRAEETTANARALGRAEAATAAAAIALTARRDAYLAGARSATSAPRAELVAPARRANSDRRATLQLYVIAALAAGLCAGLALALLLERRSRARRLLLP